MNNNITPPEWEHALRAYIRASAPALSEADRDRTRAIIRTYARFHPIRTAHEKPGVRKYLFALISGLVIVSLCAGTVSAAEHALPGDLLYPLKVNVNEEVRLALATTPEKKAEMALLRAERRVAEATEIEARGIADERVREAAENRLDSHIALAETIVIEAEALETKDEESRERVPDDREQRLLALLRAHESRVSRGEIGGSPEPEASLAQVVMTEEPSADVTASSVAPAAEHARAALMSEFASSSPETVRVIPKESRETQKAKSGREKTSGRHAEERVLQRQREAAEKRIGALAKLIERLERRGIATDGTEVLATAKDALGKGVQALEEGRSTDAAVFFNRALRTAIDGQENSYRLRNEAQESVRPFEDSSGGARERQKEDQEHD